MDKTKEFSQLITKISSSNSSFPTSSKLSSSKNLTSSVLKHPVPKVSKQDYSFKQSSIEISIVLAALEGTLLTFRTQQAPSIQALSFDSEINDNQQEISAKFESLAKRCKTMLENFFKNLNNKTASAMSRLTLHLDLSSSSLSEQAATHWRNVHEFLTARFQQTCKHFGEAMAARLRRSVAAKQYSRLSGAFATTSERPLSASDNESIRHRRPPRRPEGEWSLEELVQDASPFVAAAGERADGTADAEDEAAAEHSQFERERLSLYSSVYSSRLELARVERDVHALSRVQAFFAEEVLRQSALSQRALENVTLGELNITEANRSVRSAIATAAALRFWLLFVLLVCAFSLLFLDWYND